MIGSPGRLPGAVEGLTGEPLEEQGLTVVIMSLRCCCFLMGGILWKKGKKKCEDLITSKNVIRLQN